MQDSAVRTADRAGSLRRQRFRRRIARAGAGGRTADRGGRCAIRHCANVVLLGDSSDIPASSATTRCESTSPMPRPRQAMGRPPADDAIIIYTSGSSSRPKSVPLSHGGIIENGFNIGERQGYGPDDRVLLAPPLFWSYGSANAMSATLTHGAALVLQGRFEPGEAIDLIERHRCTALYTLPAITSAIISHPSFRPERVRSLRTGLTIGAPQDVIAAATVLGARRSATCTARPRATAIAASRRMTGRWSGAPPARDRRCRVWRSASSMPKAEPNCRAARRA